MSFLSYSGKYISAFAFILSNQLHEFLKLKKHERKMASYAKLTTVCFGYCDSFSI